MQAEYFALFDDAQQDRARLLHDYCSSEYLLARQIDEIDARLQAGWQRGQFACLLLPYEWGVALQLPDTPHHTPLAIHWFGQEQILQHNEIEEFLQKHHGNHPAGLSHVQMREHQAGYLKTIADIQEAISRGEVYQINHTVRLDVQSYGHPTALYQRLRQRQRVPYGFLGRLPAGQYGGEQWTLSLSPELFLRIQADGSVETEPMKGTAPRLHDEHDTARAQALANDSKNRAENIMIVDLLRNDLGKIAQTGGVSVPELFRVRPFGQVWQMTSLIRAQLSPSTTIASLLRATFPCGSITGTPKRMSMSKIQQWEPTPRGLYTGGIGYLKPDSNNALGYTGCINVAIRTLTLTADECADTFSGTYGVGSGIVMDSDGPTEYEECGWKSRLIRELPPEFGLIETLRVENGQCPLLHHHRLRLSIAAEQLRFPAPDDTLWQQVQHAVANCRQPSAIRLEYRADSPAIIHIRPIGPTPATVKLILQEQALPNHAFLRRFKTTHRATYDAAWRQAEQQGAFDALFFNENGELLEGGRSNVFIRIQGTWHTPPLYLDILNGIMRDRILADPQGYLKTHQIKASILTRDDVLAAEAIVVCNTVRGVIPAQLA